jgi:hypothetical protein
MKKKIRLTESELTDLIKNLVTETKRKKSVNEQEYLPVALETGDAILTIVGTTIGLLGIAGYDILKAYAKELMKSGKKKEAKEMMLTIKDMQSKGKGELGEGKACLPPREICRWNNYCMPPANCRPPWEPSTGK